MHTFILLKVCLLTYKESRIYELKAEAVEHRNRSCRIDSTRSSKRNSTNSVNSVFSIFNLEEEFKKDFAGEIKDLEKENKSLIERWMKKTQEDVGKLNEANRFFEEVLISDPQFDL